MDTFQETGRADESVLFQKFFRLVPGTYQLTVTIRDLQSGTINKAEQTLVVAPFGTATTSAPILAYQVTGRERLDQSLRIVLNPRGAVAFGGDTLLAYLEGYGYRRPDGGAVRGADRDRQPGVQRLAPLPRRPSGGEPVHQAPARQHGAG